MKSQHSLGPQLVLGAVFLASLALSAPSQAAEDQIVTLTQVPCQFLETEARNQKFNTTRSEDCQRINQETANQRKLRTLELKPGKTIFRVSNANVPYELGFYLRGHGLGFVTLPKVSGGGLTPGKTQDYVVDLKPGEYDFSCPLNPTPDYRLIVKG